MSLTFTAEPVPLTVDKNGAVRVGGTRVTLDTVVGTFAQGCSPEEIVTQYSSLKLADVYAVVTFYLRHKKEVDEYLRQREEAAERIRGENERRYGSQAELRKKLLERRNQVPTT